MQRKTNPYEEFAAIVVPQVDGLIRDFYAEKIKSATADFIKNTYKDLAEYCGRGGKRIRPVLLLAAYNGYASGKKNTSEMLFPAAAVEMMHSFLLIQDDIIDKSATRRGGKAMHITSAERYGASFGADVASIIADVLFANALSLAARADICNRARRRFLSAFAASYEKTAFGQIMDIVHSRPQSLISNDIPLQISTMKTAYYTMYYPLLMGRSLAVPDDEEEAKRIEAFALPLGLAFQIRDDVLGVFGSEEETGKPADSDIREGKFTMLIQNTAALLPDDKRKSFEKKFLSHRKSAADVNAIKTAIKESGGLDASVRKQREFADKAAAALGELRISKTGREILACLPDMFRL